MRIRLEVWEDKVEELRQAPAYQTKAGKEVYDGLMRELLDRLETVRIKLEKLKRVSDASVDAARAEIEQALTALHHSWHSAVSRIAATDPLQEATSSET